MPSKVAIDPEDPSLGRIRADSVTPPHSPASIKRCISRVERTPALVNADLFVDMSCNTPLKEDTHISFLRTDCPGLSPKKPMAIVQMAIDHRDPSIPDGGYYIKNRAEDFYWYANSSPIATVRFSTSLSLRTMSDVNRRGDNLQKKVNEHEHSLIIHVFRG